MVSILFLILLLVVWVCLFGLLVWFVRLMCLLCLFLLVVFWVVGYCWLVLIVVAMVCDGFGVCLLCFVLLC